MATGDLHRSAIGSAFPCSRRSARENGIAALAYVDMYHVGALWPEVEWLAQEGMVASRLLPRFPMLRRPAGPSRSMGRTRWGSAGRAPVSRRWFSTRPPPPWREAM